MWDVVADNARGFATGLVVGFGLARGLVIVESKVKRDGESGEASERRPPRSIRVIVIFVTSFVLFVSGMYVGFKVLEHKYTCLDTYANDLADSLEPRQTAAATLQEKQAVINVAIAALFATFDKTEAEQQTAADALKLALDDYNKAERQLEHKRQQNPYPDAPRKVCND